MYQYPKITVDLDKLLFNANTAAGWCHERGISLAVVCKSFCADPVIMRALESSGADFFADSRVLNLQRMDTGKKRLLMRIAMPGEADEIVRCADMSMQSEIETVFALDRAAGRAGVRHGILMAMDMGDLREGVFFRETAAIDALTDAVVSCKNLELLGVAVNFSCYGGILPDDENQAGLVEIARRQRERTGLPLPIVSGGNTTSVLPLLNGKVPAGITNLRLGESILLGFSSSDGCPVPGLRGDVFTITAQLVEIQNKPSKPVGVSAYNAFGEPVFFEDRGPMRRGILALGRQDTDLDKLTPLDDRIEILGGSSDHLLVNLSGAPEYRVGDTLSFYPAYGALLKAYTGDYMTKDHSGALPL